MQFNLFNPDYYITIHNLINGKRELFIKNINNNKYFFIEF